MLQSIISVLQRWLYIEIVLKLWRKSRSKRISPSLLSLFSPPLPSPPLKVCFTRGGRTLMAACPVGKVTADTSVWIATRPLRVPPLQERECQVYQQLIISAVDHHRRLGVQGLVSFIDPRMDRCISSSLELQQLHKEGALKLLRVPWSQFYTDHYLLEHSKTQLNQVRNFLYDQIMLHNYYNLLFMPCENTWLSLQDLDEFLSLDKQFNSIQESISSVLSQSSSSVDQRQEECIAVIYFQRHDIMKSSTRHSGLLSDEESSSSTPELFNEPSFEGFLKESTCDLMRYNSMGHEILKKLLIRPASRAIQTLLVHAAYLEPWCANKTMGMSQGMLFHLPSMIRYRSRGDASVALPIPPNLSFTRLYKKECEERQ